MKEEVTKGGRNEGRNEGSVNEGCINEGMNKGRIKWKEQMEDVTNYR